MDILTYELGFLEERNTFVKVNFKIEDEQVYVYYIFSENQSFKNTIIF